MPDHILAIDQGTTSTRCMAFDAALTPVAVTQREFAQIFPAPGWVEHDPEEIWDTTVATVRDAMAKAGLAAKDIAGIGITNQRETTIVWDRQSGKPIHNAIVWQDRRTADVCAALREAGHEAAITAKTGLVLDPYFSLRHQDRLDPGSRRRRARGGGVRAARVRDRRCVPVVAADRRPRACDRRYQWGAHPPARYPHGHMGRRPHRSLPRAARAPAGGA
jgi:glycerol kinase